MAAFDYSELLSTAQELVAEFGRDIGIYNVVDGALPVTAEPWEPLTHDPVPTDPDPLAPTVVKGVIIPSAFKKEDGTLVEKGVFTGYIAAAPGLTIGEKDRIIDGGVNYRVDKITLYAPGDTELLWVLRLVQ